MYRKLGVRALHLLCVALLLVGSSVVAANTEPIEVHSDVVAIEAHVSRQPENLVPSNFVERLATTEEPAPNSDALAIAEPGGLGLMVLAGLMGGAIAMRRRLG